MIFDQHGLPKDNGATDYMDSCRLAGLLATFNHPKAVNMTTYLTPYGDGLRHPYEPTASNPRNFTRDQLIPLATGLYMQNKEACVGKLYYGAVERGYRAQNTEADVPGSVKRFPDGADILAPHDMSLLNKCAGGAITTLGRVFMVMSILGNALFTPRRESNQLLCALKVYGPSWMRFYKRVTPRWREAIKDYWCGWRDEPELAKYLITEVEKI